MSFVYTRAQLKTAINRGIQGKIGMLIDSNETCNEAVREVIGDCDMRTAERRIALAPNLFNGIYDYNWPNDAKSTSIIDITSQAPDNRQDREWSFITPEEFEILKPASSIAIDNYNGVSVLKVNSKIDSQSLIISELDSTVSNGTWTTFGDAINLAADTDDYIKGAGSLKFDISAAGGTTAGIQCSNITSFDMTNYFGGTSAFFIWARITSVTNLTNYKLQFGSSASSYYTQTVTTQADGTSLVNGWNLLQFNVSNYTTTGSPDRTAMTYFAVYMTKTSGKISETDYKFDYLVLKRGTYSYLKYYSKYGWQTAAGAYVENSTSDSDFLTVDTDELELIVKAGRYIAGNEVDLSAAGRNPMLKLDQLQKDYQSALTDYIQDNPSRSILMTTQYYNYGPSGDNVRNGGVPPVN